MSETMFTEGPWHLRGSTVLVRPTLIIAECDRGNKHPDTAMANARLIAAAPELLNACQAALRSLQCVNEQIEGLDLPLSDIEAAIAKVLGKQRDAK